MFLLSPIFFFSDLIIQRTNMSVVDQGCSGFWTLRLMPNQPSSKKTKSIRDSLCVSFTAHFTYTSSFLWAVSKMATFLNISDVLTWRSSWYIHNFQYLVEILFSSSCMSIVRSKYVTYTVSSTRLCMWEVTFNRRARLHFPRKLHSLSVPNGSHPPITLHQTKSETFSIRWVLVFVLKRRDQKVCGERHEKVIQHSLKPLLRYNRHWLIHHILMKSRFES